MTTPSIRMNREISKSSMTTEGLSREMKLQREKELAGSEKYLAFHLCRFEALKFKCIGNLCRENISSFFLVIKSKPSAYFSAFLIEIFR